MSQISLHKKALLLSYLTVGYNLFEGVLSLLAGTLAGSIMIWRFRLHAHLTAAEEERREKLAIKLVGWTFFGLAAYVFYESLKKLAFQEPPAPSLLGIIIALASLILMPLLFALKLRT